MKQLPLNFLKNLDWTPTLFLILTPIASLFLTSLYFYLYDFHWGFILLFIVMYSLTALSITAGYHRLWSHRAYEANSLLKIFFATFGAAAFQNSILKWSVDHRLHHRHVDTDADPYSIKRGFFFAHMGWMCLKQDWPKEAKALSRDLERDPIVLFQHKHYVPIAIIVGFFLPAFIGALMGSALGGLAIGGFLRIVALHHGTFLINSACHWWGNQPYTNLNTARDNAILAVLTFGEGYHNFHHLFASDYRNGIRWYHWDPTKWLIRLNSYFGFARNLRKTEEEKIFQARFLKEKNRIESLVSLEGSRWNVTLEQLTKNIEHAQTRFVELKAEYQKLKMEKTKASMEKIKEIKVEVHLAKIHFQNSVKVWRRFQIQMKQVYL